MRMRLMVVALLVQYGTSLHCRWYLLLSARRIKFCYPSLIAPGARALEMRFEAFL